jgi:murein DD-endopeptidase MepM/ murein hydrolase activator NlpD
MPRDRRWILALFVLACVVAAPMHAPYYEYAEQINDRFRVAAPTDHAPENLDDDHAWDGYLFPGDDRIETGYFSRFLYAGTLPDPDEYVRRSGVGTPTGGGEPQDVSVQFVDGSRVFPLARGSFRISQEFGCVPFNPGYSRPDFCPPDRPSFHHGVDFAANEGTTIFASATGTVNFADIDQSNSAGNTIIRIIHDGPNSGYLTEYFHWQRSFVSMGDYVIAGQPIGEVASIGYSTGPHLHFGVFDFGVGQYIDPLDWLRGSESLHIAATQGGVGGGDDVMQWMPLIREAAQRYGIPAGLIAAIITVESGGNPEAVSPAGAQGLMQVMPMHFERYGIPSNMWRDPATNIDIGTRFLAELVQQHGTLTNAVGAYFGHGCDVLGTCTEDYIAAVFSWFSHFVPLFGDVAFEIGHVNPTPAPTVTASPQADSLPELSPTPQASETPTPMPAVNEEPSPAPTAEPADAGESVTTDKEDQLDDGADDGEESRVTPTPGPTPVPEPSDNDAPENDDQVVFPDPRTVDAFESRWSVDPDAGVVLRLNPEDNTIIAVTEVGLQPWAIAASNEHIWVVNRGDMTLQQIDPKTNQVELTTDLPGRPVGIAFVNVDLWVALDDLNTLISYDLELVKLADIISLPDTPCQLWFDANDRKLVVRLCEADDLQRYDPLI